MNFQTVRTILAKELREVLRDRRTLFLMIGIPVFLYPALFVLMEQVAIFGQQEMERKSARVAVVQPAGETAQLLPPDSDFVYVEVTGDPAANVRAGAVEAVVVVEELGGEMGTTRARIYYDASRDRSAYARSRLEDHLRVTGDSLLQERLRRMELGQEFAAPIAVRDSSVATPAGMGGAALGRFLPMILILMTVLGAFHPAIDLAAGERERNTLEPLLTTPVSNGTIVTGKFLAVAVIALTTATLNLASMLFTLQAGLFQFTREIGLDFHLPLPAIALILVLLSLLALFFAALFMGIAVRAQSFREAQSALTPVYIVSFLPAIVTTAPGVEFTTGFALVPVAGVALLFRALMAGDPVGLEGFIAVGATVVYVCLALAFAGRVFGREDVVFGGGDSESRGLLGGLRRWRDSEDEGTPAPAAALLFVAGVAALFFYVGLRFQSWGEPGIFASQWLLLGLPAVAFVVLGPYDVRASLGIRAAPPRAYPAAALIVLGGIPIGWLIAWIQSAFLEIPEEFLRGMEGLLRADDPVRLAWLLLLIAVTPALCEELVFRGVLLRGLSSSMSTRAAIVISAVVFGAFHLSFETAIRFLPTTFIGLLLAFVAVRTRSIFPGMLMHFLNNGTIVLFISMPSLQALVVTEDAPRWWIVLVGAMALAAGIRLLPGRLPDDEAEAVEPDELSGSGRPEAVAASEAGGARV